MIKILLFSNAFDDTFGGMEEHRKAFVLYFKGHSEYDLILLSNADNSYCIEINGEKVRFDNISNLISHMQTFVCSEDVFFFNDFRWVNDMEFLRKQFSNNKFIVRSGGNDILRAPVYNDSVSLSVRQNKLVEIINGCVNCLIVNSDYSYIVNRDIGINPMLMKKIRGGVDYREVYSLYKERTTNRTDFDAKYGTNGKKVITLACRLVPFKGILQFLQQIKPTFDSNAYRLLIIGNGPLLEEIRIALDKDFKDSYILIEGANHATTMRYLSISDVVINPSIYFKRYFGNEWFFHTETMGRTMIEAIALNIPIMATNVGGTSELFFENPDENIGLLVDNYDLFADKIQRIQFIHEFKDYASQYSWESIFEKYKLLFAGAGKRVFCFDLDGTIVDKNTDESSICSILQEHQGDIVILNTARKSCDESIQFFENSGAEYLIYNNGCGILSKKSRCFVAPYVKSQSQFEDLDKVELKFITCFGAEQIERTHINCLSIEKDPRFVEFLEKECLDLTSIELIYGEHLIKVINKNMNKKQAMLYIIKDVFCNKLVVAGDATNDIPFMQVGSCIYSAEEIAHLIGKPVITFNKQESKTELLRRIFNE